MALFNPPAKPEHPFWKWLTRLGATLFFGVIVTYALLIFWPAEGDRSFDSAVWKENTNALDLNIRTSMRKDLAARIKTERWTRSRVLSELGEAGEHNSNEFVTYSLGRRRGAWPFRHFGFLTSFDRWYFRITFDENGVSRNAHASGS